MKFDEVRKDYRVIFEMVAAGSKVLDLGCGEGDLLYLLAKEKGAKVQGIELDDKAIYKCVEKGVSVFHDDIDRGLKEYPDGSFDYVILNQTLQQVRQVDLVIHEALRVGKYVIVGFPNFAQWSSRIQLFWGGRAPVTRALPYSWYNSPNLRFLSIKDFEDLCRQQHFRIERRVVLANERPVHILPNLRGTMGIFLITKGRA